MSVDCNNKYKINNKINTIREILNKQLTMTESMYLYFLLTYTYHYLYHLSHQ